ncbi:MAG: hypothetical protein LAO09_15110 [Acidobacteriia bacterium]|nr:hypothetical protein [Terriglobia bacterium]
MHDYPTLHTMVKDARSNSPHEVRHLLIHPIKNESGFMLTKLVSGIQSEIATGKLYEVEQRADAAMQEWAREGFRYRREREPAYEDLKSTVTLAMLMGYKVVYDPAYADVRRMNLMGAVPLTQWLGRAGKNGGGYQYAFTGTTILASPTLPPGHGINMAPSTEEFLQTMRQAIEIQKTVGSMVELILG